MLIIQDPAIFPQKTLRVRAGHTYRYIDQQPVHKAASVVLCLHGFPELAFSWRYQIIDLVGRGNRVIAPDLLGYGDSLSLCIPRHVFAKIDSFGNLRFGGTSKPLDVKEYAKASICKSLVEILDHEGITGKITVLSHDWGSILAARFLTYFPERVKFWITLCVPPSAPAQPERVITDYTAIIRQHLPQFGYQLYFMSPESNEELDRYCQAVLLLLYFHMERGLEEPIQEKLSKYKRDSIVYEGVLQKQLQEVGNELESMTIQDPEIAYFASEIKKSGLSAALNWYRARLIDQNDELAAGLPAAFSSHIQCLFIGAPEDPVLPPLLFTEALKSKMFPSGNITCINIPGGNHFLLEAASHRDQVNEVIGNWLDSQEKILLSA